MNKKLSLEALNRISAEEFQSVPKIPVTIVLDNIRSLHNVGSIFRTSDAFLIEKILLTGITGTPPNKEIYKSALGAENTVAWQYEKDAFLAAKNLQSKGYQIILIEQTKKSVPIDEFVPAGKIAVFFGNEVDGVTESLLEIADVCVEIPQFGTKHSLNVSVAAGIVIHYLSKFYIRK